MGVAFRWVLWTLLALVGLVALTVTLLVTTAAGREVIADRVERFTTSKIPGSMKIGTIESVGFLRPVATDVEFFDPNGDRVVHAKRAEAEFALAELFAGKIAFAKARVDGGEVVIDVPAEGRVTIKAAFKPLSQSESTSNKAELELHNMHFEDMTVLLRLSGETRFVLRDVQGFVRVWRRDTPGVRVALDNVQGTFEKPQILGETIVLEHLKGEVWAQEDHVVSMQLATKIGSGGIDASFNYHAHPEKRAHLKLNPQTGSGANLVAIGTSVRSWFSDKLEVEIE